MKAFHLAALAAASSLAIAAPAFAAGAKMGHATGVVTAVDAKAKTVTIKHGPIPAVGWPAMTMTFKANPAHLAKTVKVGDHVAFDVKVQGQDDEVTAIKKQ